MSDLRVTNLKGRTAGSAPTLPDGAVITGVTTSTSFDGDLNASQLASGTIPDDRFPATLPAVNGSALTDLNIPEGFSELDAALFN
tara:strand:+ start:350 stop:604 length:255 start_codon:yes stop_codon:yes gene_type:complete